MVTITRIYNIQKEKIKKRKNKMKSIDKTCIKRLKELRNKNKGYEYLYLHSNKEAKEYYIFFSCKEEDDLIILSDGIELKKIRSEADLKLNKPQSSKIFPLSSNWWIEYGYTPKS